MRSALIFLNWRHTLVSFLTNLAADKLYIGDVDGFIDDLNKVIEESSASRLRTGFNIIVKSYGIIHICYYNKSDYDGSIWSFEKSIIEYTRNIIKHAFIFRCTTCDLMDFKISTHT